MQWRVEWNFPELPEIGRSNELYPIVLVVVVLLFICFCFFLPQQYNTSLLCNTLSIWIYFLAFCWMVHILESQQFSGFPEKFLWDVFLTSKVPQLWVVYRVGRTGGNHCATLTFNFFQEFCATVNYLIRISANFLFNGLKTSSLRNLWKLFRENFLPNSFPFQLSFCSRTVIDSFPAHKSRPYLIGCLDECLRKPARVEDQIAASLLVLSSARCLENFEP